MCKNKYIHIEIHTSLYIQIKYSNLYITTVSKITYLVIIYNIGFQYRKLIDEHLVIL